MDLACGVSSARNNVKTALAALLLRNPMRFVPAPASAEKPAKPSTRPESHSRRSFTALLVWRPVAKETRNSVGWGKAAASATNARAPAHRSAPRRQSYRRQKLRTHPELNRGPIGLQPIALPLSYESTNARARTRSRAGARRMPGRPARTFGWLVLAALFAEAGWSKTFGVASCTKRCVRRLLPDSRAPWPIIAWLWAGPPILANKTLPRPARILDNKLVNGRLCAAVGHLMRCRCASRGAGQIICVFILLSFFVLQRRFRGVMHRRL
ncbi:hypothetical protein ERJ75_000332900 [Trypanosoma vivax]|nr:hypothetical protein ERJ75_000332900 [Trypanosoma vivax]